MKDALWSRVRAGRNTALVGGPLPPLPAAASLCAVRVSCERGGGPLAPIREAQAKVDRLLDEASPPLFFQGSGPADGGLRRRLLGEEPLVESRIALVQAFNRLGACDERPCALVFDAVEAADPATLALLEEILARPGSLRIPLVLGFRSEGGPAAQRLLASLRRVEGDDAILRPEATGLEPEGDAALPPLDADTRLALRAAAVIGPVFEAELCAELLGVARSALLARLQLARDQGFPLEDLGDGTFRMPLTVAAALRGELLPSVAAGWHHHLGQLVSPAPLPAAPEHEAAQSPPASALLPWSQDHGRAAEHYASAGRPHDAAQRMLDSAREAAGAGAYAEAVAFATEALATIDRAPRAPARDVLRDRIRGEIGRLQWLAAGPGGPGFSLRDALVTLDGILDDGAADAVVEAEIRALAAQVLYDVGDADALERALEELATATRLLDALGRPLEAARLLNDQAAVWVRIGDPVRARRLLQQSRRAFEAMARVDASDPTARAELAETEHLLARLPLHVAAKPGLEEEALRRGLLHAQAASDAYRALGQRRELARVHETMGRLELAGGEAEAAVRHLDQAVTIQQQIGDVLGLARSADALSFSLAQLGREHQALDLLAESVQLNLEKGSPLGLAYNLRSLQVLMESFDAEVRRTLSRAAGQLFEQIRQAQRQLER